MNSKPIRRIILWVGLPAMFIAAADFVLHGFAIETLLVLQLALGLMIWVALLDIRAALISRKGDEQ